MKGGEPLPDLSPKIPRLITHRIGIGIGDDLLRLPQVFVSTLLVFDGILPGVLADVRPRVLLPLKFRGILFMVIATVPFWMLMAVRGVPEKLFARIAESSLFKVVDAAENENVLENLIPEAVQLPLGGMPANYQDGPRQKHADGPQNDQRADGHTRNAKP